MKIGFDGKRATNNLTGLGNYSRSLIAQLSLFFPQNQYLIYTPKVKQVPPITTFLKLKSVVLKLPRIGSLFWRSLWIKNDLVKDKIDIFHGLSHEIPLGIKSLNIPTVVTIHDLIFLKFPDYFKPIDRIIYRLKCTYACRNASRIIAISERTKLDLIELLGVAEEKINVIYQSCDDGFKSQASAVEKQQVVQQFGLPDKFILNVGTIETRKNLLTLIKALKNVNHEYNLVVVGKRTDYFNQVSDEIKRLELQQRVIFLENVPFSMLPVIYQKASVFVYPSVYEGFGIPIIEALYSGVPVIAAMGSCLEEAGGKDSQYVSPFDHRGFAAAINKVIDSEDLGKSMIIKGLEYVKIFDKKNISDQLMNIYESLVNSK